MLRKIRVMDSLKPLNLSSPSLAGKGLGVRSLFHAIENRYIKNMVFS
jgi:hypothetical protein